MLLFEQLRRSGRYAIPARFSVMREMADLFKRISDRNVKVPRTLGEFEAMLDEERDRLALRAIAEEAELVLWLWHAHAKEDDALMRRTKGLRRLELPPGQALVAVRADDFPACLDDFLREAGAQVLAAGPGEAGRLVLRAWGKASSPGDPRAEAPAGPRLLEGADFETTARIAAEEIRRRAGDGESRVGVVLFDRVLARRVQAVAADRGLRVADRSGWISSTLLVGSMLLLYCEIASGEASPEGLEDFVASTGTFYDRGREDVGEAVRRLRMARAPDRPARGDSALDAIRSAVRGRDGASELLRELADEFAASPLRRAGEATLHEWVLRVLGATRQRALRGVFRGDAPARDITAMLTAHLPELEPLEGKVACAEFRSWLSDLLEDNFVAPSDNESEVSFLSLGQAWLQQFDSLMLLGCSAGNLPAAREYDFFNGALREQLGLDSSEEEIDDQKRKLAVLLERHPGAVALWPRSGLDGSRLLPSPLFEALSGAVEDAEEALGSPWETRPEDLRLPPEPQDGAEAAVPAELLGRRRLSVTSFDQMMGCPFLFFADRLLRPETEEEEKNSVMEYGNVAHEAMERVGRRVMESEDPPTDEEMAALIREVAADAFVSKFGPMRGKLELAGFEQCVPELVKMEAVRRREGWRTCGVEREVEGELEIGGGRPPLSLKGKIDRVDRRDAPDGARYAIADYKSKASYRLKGMSKADGEYPQAALYAEMLARIERAPVESCRLIRLRKDSSDKAQLLHEVLGAEESRDYPRRLWEHFGGVLGRIADGAALPANGDVKEVCKHCEMGGLCRRPLWSAGPRGPEAAQGRACAAEGQPVRG